MRWDEMRVKQHPVLQPVCFPSRSCFCICLNAVKKKLPYICQSRIEALPVPKLRLKKKKKRSSSLHHRRFFRFNERVVSVCSALGASVRLAHALYMMSSYHIQFISLITIVHGNMEWFTLPSFFFFLTKFEWNWVYRDVISASYWGWESLRPLMFFRCSAMLLPSIEDENYSWYCYVFFCRRIALVVLCWRWGSLELTTEHMRWKEK